MNGDSLDKKYDVVALGELLIDFTENGESPQGNPLLEANPGGAPCNVLAMLQKLGKRTAFIGKVGNDAFGKMLAETVSGIGIDICGLIFDKQTPTTLAFVHTAPDGDRDFSFYRNPGADMMLRKEEVMEDLIIKSRIFHFGTLSSTHAGVREATRYAVQIARENGLLISFDPNLREPLWHSLEDARNEIAYGMSMCDVLKISDNELEFMTGTTDYTRAVAILQEKYRIPLIFATLGKCGSRAYYKNIVVEAPAFIQANTIETTGAGDTFTGCALSYLLDDGIAPDCNMPQNHALTSDCNMPLRHDVNRHMFEALSEEKLHDLLVFANAAASIITTRKGALKIMPEPDEIAALIRTDSSSI